MKTIIKELKRINKVLAELDSTEKNIHDMPYYKIFGSQFEKERDLDIVTLKRAMYLNLKFTTLESLQIECEKAKYAVSSKQRTLKIA